MIPHNKSIRQPELLLGCGYTGHEHLPWFGLINMNARLYDPATRRFLNPDPVVQLPDNTQSYNRYSYCLNNPLRYTDPTGLFRALPKEFWQTSYKEDEYEGEPLGLHQLHNQWRENVIVPQVKDGTVGLPANQPFK